MLAVVPEKRRDGKSSFVKLVSYVSLRENVEMAETLSPEKPFVRKSRSEAVIFNDLLDYATRNPVSDEVDLIASFPDGRQQLRSGDVIIETNCFSLTTAASEMNMVGMQNTRCVDPVYHVILSWPECDRPSPEEIFSSARHCVKRMGMEGHQYLFAIHDDTDNLHVHLTVNRVNPLSYKAASLYNDRFTLDRCCRELELKHGWKHDNGPFVVNSEGAIVRSKNLEILLLQRPASLSILVIRKACSPTQKIRCRKSWKSLFLKADTFWEDIHNVLHTAGLELRTKGQGLAVYDLSDEHQVPLRASRLHPELTLGCQQELIGGFSAAPEIREIDSRGRTHRNERAYRIALRQPASSPRPGRTCRTSHRACRGPRGSDCAL